MLDGSFGDREEVINSIKINPTFDEKLFDVTTRINISKNQ